jgi:hypothetical protein
MRTILAALLAGAALVLAAGCGSSGNNAAATTAAAETTTAATTASTDTASTDTTSTDTTATDTTAGAAAAAGLSAGCQKVADLSVRFGKALSAAGASGNGQTDMNKTAEAYKAFAAQVPEEIRPAFMTLADAFAQYAKALQGIDLSSGKTPDAATIAKLAKAAQSLNSKDLSAADAKITTWVAKNCKTGG